MKLSPKDTKRFLSKVRLGDVDGCWEWTGSRLPTGYGRFSLGGRRGGNHYAHRIAYEHFVGPIPEGLDLDHLCRVRPCVNPWHLEPVTRRENLLRGVSANALKRHCPAGHPYVGENIEIEDGRRRCRICRRETKRRSDRTRRAARRSAA